MKTPPVTARLFTQVQQPTTAGKSAANASAATAIEHIAVAMYCTHVIARSVRDKVYQAL